MRIVVLISGRGSNLAAILAAQAEGRLGAGRVVGVVCNRPGAPGLRHADRHEIRTAVIDHRSFASRSDFDIALEGAVADFEPDLVVLAGFMRILGGPFVRRYRDRLINTHPSLLPKFPGLHAVKRALEAGASTTGCTVHFVVEAVDSGPILAQAEVPLSADDSLETLEARVLAQEHQLLPETIRRFCSGELATSETSQ